MTETLPKTQRAWVLRRTGKPRDVLQLEEDYQIPVPKSSQILIKVHAVALNPGGWKAFSVPPLSFVHKTPAVPEFDFSGVIAGGTLDGTGYVMGQEVFGISPFEGPNGVMKVGQGALAQYTVAEPATFVAKPSNITHAEAAAFPIAGLTAFVSLVNHGGLKLGDGKRIFVNGGSGGIGSWAVQIAKAYGAYVVTTCSPESQSLVNSLGADGTIDYRSVHPSLSAHLASIYSTSKFDLFFDTVGTDVSALYAASPSYLKPDGIYLDIAGAAHIMDSVYSALTTILGMINRILRPAFLGGTPRKYLPITFWATSMTNELKESAELLASGKIKAPIDHIYAFEDALQGYDRQMSGRSKGKLIISVSLP